MDQLLKNMQPGLPQGQVRDLSRKPPKQSWMIENGGVYEFFFVSGHRVILKVEGQVPTPVHHDPENNLLIVVPTIGTGIVVHKNKTTGEWESDSDDLHGFVFPHVVHWRVLHDPSEAKAKETPDASAP